jgi:hypothetical protein
MQSQAGCGLHDIRYPQWQTRQKNTLDWASNTLWLQASPAEAANLGNPRAETPRRPTDIDNKCTTAPQQQVLRRSSNKQQTAMKRRRMD